MYSSRVWFFVLCALSFHVPDPFLDRLFLSRDRDRRAYRRDHRGGLVSPHALHVALVGLFAGDVAAVGAVVLSPRQRRRLRREGI